MPRRHLFLVWLAVALAGCSSSSPVSVSTTPQTIRTDGLYRSIDKTGATDKKETIYKLVFLRFLPDGKVHVAASEGAFDVEKKTKQVAQDGYLSDSKLDDEGSVGKWTLNGNVLEFVLKWKMRGRWTGPDGRKSFALSKDGEEFEFSETHKGTVDGETLVMSLHNEQFNSRTTYTAKFVPLSFSKPETKNGTTPK